MIRRLSKSLDCLLSSSVNLHHSHLERRGCPLQALLLTKDKGAASQQDGGAVMHRYVSRLFTNQQSFLQAGVRSRLCFGHWNWGDMHDNQAAERFAKSARGIPSAVVHWGTISCEVQSRARWHAFSRKPQCDIPLCSRLPCVGCWR